MVRFSDELLDEIKSKNDIVDVISEYVILKRSGRNFFGLCPFHKEKSPSFSVSVDKQIFHCFGCGVGGDVFRFIGQIENLNFIESVKHLAEKANVEVPISNNDFEDKNSILKDKIYKINEVAALFYHENLYKPTAVVAQQYVKKRKLDNKTLKMFMIGFSGRFDELYRLLKSKGFSEEEILASNLVNKNPDGKFIDRFRNRLMFPIFDVRNKVIAFGGRVLDDSKPKYINSAEGLVYNKGRNLFALNIAKTYRPKTIIMVEGYMDAVSLHQRGIHNVVASLGTALTEGQGRLLRRNCETVIIGYDSDGAGQAATMRGLEILNSLGCDIRILQIEGAKDPDEFIIKYGVDKFQWYVNNSISLVEFKVKNLKKELNLDNINDKIKFLNEVAKILSKVENNMERELYVDKIARDYLVSKDAIYAEINKMMNSAIKSEKKLESKSKVHIESNVSESDSVDEKTLRREKLIIYMLVNYPNQSYEIFKDKIKIDYICDLKNKQIIEKIFLNYESGKFNIDTVISWFDDENIINYLSGIMASDFEISSVEKSLEDVIKFYEKDYFVKQRNDILKKLENTNNKEESLALEKQLNDVIIKLAKMK